MRGAGRGLFGPVAALALALALVALPMANADASTDPAAGNDATVVASAQPTTEPTSTDEPSAPASTDEPSAPASTDEPSAPASTDEPSDESTDPPSGESTDPAPADGATDPATTEVTTDPTPNLPPKVGAKDATQAEAITPMVIGEPDGGAVPYVYWDVRDIAGNLVPGATFQFEFRSAGGTWTTGTNAGAITDCNGTCPTTSLERDGDGGEWLLEHRATARTTTTRLVAGTNYRVSQVTAPSGYQWVVGGLNRSIGPSRSGTATWNDGDGTGTHDFGTFYVRATSAANLPSCQPGFVYGISETGQIREIAPNGTVTNLGTPASGVSSFNGIGIGSNGSRVFAYERTNNTQTATIWTYTTATGTWATTGHSINSTLNSRTVDFVAGAVNLQNGRYYLGGFSPDGTRFRLWEYDPATNTSTFKGEVDTSTGSGGARNGDLAFDAVGNLFIVRGSGTTTTVFSVTAANLAEATGGLIPSSGSSSVTTMGDVNGVAFDSSGKAFLGSGSQLRSYDMPNWSNSTTVVSANLTSTDLATCSSPPIITVEKYIEGGRVQTTDQFGLTLTQGAQTIGTATTTGTAIGLQGQRIGPLPTVRGVELNFSEVASGTTVLTDYVSSYRCLVDGVQTVQGNGTSGSITIPANGQSINCRFYNSPLVASVTIHKDVTDVSGLNPTARQGWTVGAATTATMGTATPTPTTTTQLTDASGNAAWSIRFDAYTSRATVTVSETQQTGYDFASGQCVVTHLDGTTATTTLTGTTGQALTGVAPGDVVVCTYVNKPKAGSVTWTKVDDSSPAVVLGGSEWTITGPGFPAPGTVIVDCVAVACAGPDMDPAVGAFRLEGLAWGEYTVTESKVPAGHTGAAQFTFTVDASNAGTVLPQGNKVNPRLPGSVTWTKVDDSSPAVVLGGSEWTITGPGFPAPGTVIVDCVAVACAGPDKDPAVGAFRLEGLAWGEYTVTESKVPAGHTGAAQFTFTVDASNAGTVLPQGNKVNSRIPGTVTWNKVDADATDTRLAGSAWRLTGDNVPSGTIVTDCTAAPCVPGPYAADQDPVAGQFRLAGLAWGTYSLVETTAPPGYLLDTTEHPFTVGADNVASVIVVGPFTNQVVTPPTLPLTGGLARDFYTLAGGALIGTALVGFGVKRRRTRATVTW